MPMTLFGAVFLEWSSRPLSIDPRELPQHRTDVESCKQKLWTEDGGVTITPWSLARIPTTSTLCAYVESCCIRSRNEFMVLKTQLPRRRVQHGQRPPPQA